MSNDTSSQHARHPFVPAIFLGAYGLRAGWRLLMFLALLAGISAASSPLARRMFHALGQDFSARNVIASEIFSFAVIFLVTLVMSRFEHRRLGDYGLPLRGML